MGFFDSLEDDIVNNVNQMGETLKGNDPIESSNSLDETENTPHVNCDEENTQDFFTSISMDSYRQRGFIKEGELIENPADFMGTTRLWDPVPFKDREFSFTRYLGDKCIVTRIGSVPATTEKIKEAMLDYVRTKVAGTRNFKFYVFDKFQDTDTKFVHDDRCYEFKGYLEFVEAVDGWVLYDYKRAIFITPKN